IRYSLEQPYPEFPEVGKVICRLQRVFFTTWDIIYDDLGEVLEDFDLQEDMRELISNFNEHFLGVMKFKITMAVFIWLLESSQK
ncbi:UNVERIFIED_CONTAM: hypothetical protein LI988_08810, partial [Campylobacter jejuni]